MWWYLFFVLIVIIISMPLVYQIKLSFDVINMAGEFLIKIWFIKIKIKAKIKNNYIYITKKGITYKEKLTPKNIDLQFILQFLKSLYFRGVLIKFMEESEIGYLNNALTTACISTATDIAVKCLMGKVKTNKKYSQISINNNPVYDKDCINLKLDVKFAINFFDILYSILASKINAKGTKYEKEQDIEQQLGIE